MRKKLFILVCIISASMYCSAQQAVNWEKCQWLIGNWKGIGSGQPGQGEGSFSFYFDLDKRILTRKNHTVFPSVNGSPAATHDDLMIVYADNSGSPSKAIYFDNEGHTINYTVIYTENSATFKSNKEPGIPVFRLTYGLLEKNIVNIKFEMSQDGVNFRTYLEGKSQKTE